MGLTTALNISNTGLRTIQSGLTSVANNVAQSEVEGYRRQDMVAEKLSINGGVTSTVRRSGDSYLENQYRVETARTAAAEVDDYYLSRVDQLFGQPGEAGALDTMLNDFSTSLEKAATSPEDYTSRQMVVSAADNLASNLNTISDQVQALRQTAEKAIASEVSDINDALSRLETLNVRLSGGGETGTATHAELLNERDSQINRIADAMEIRVAEQDSGRVTIFSKSGNTLLDASAVQLNFDQKGHMTAQTQYDIDDDKRGVGTITLENSTGYQIDLMKNGMLDTGRIGALINMRDDVLVQAQAQLDEVAAGLANAASAVEVEGTDVTAGAASGQDINLDGLQKGNSISLSYTEAGQTKNVTIVRVDDPSLLPLSDDHTASYGDKVIGVDFSGGYAAAASAINSEQAPSVNVSANADGLRFLDDGATGNSDISSVSSTQTLSDLQSGNLGLPLFMDGSNAQTGFTGAMEGLDQKVGFAGRISVNNDLKENNELLVKFNADTNIGDGSRPQAIIDKLNNMQMSFSPDAGIGAQNSPFTGTVMDYASQMISEQTGKASSAAQALQSQEVVHASIENRLAEVTGVSIDEELAKLIDYQNSYAANARIMQVVDEMYDSLMRI